PDAPVPVVVRDVVEAVGGGERGVGAVPRPAGPVPALSLPAVGAGEVQLERREEGHRRGVAVGGGRPDAELAEGATRTHPAAAAGGVEVDRRRRGEHRARQQQRGEDEETGHACQGGYALRATAPSTRWSSGPRGRCAPATPRATDSAGSRAR